MHILGISAFYHDSAACLLNDGEIIAAAQEERFTRKKNDAGFPFNAISFCLDYANIRLKDIDYIVFYEKPFLKFERLVETYVSLAPFGISSFMKSMPIWMKDKLFQKRTIIKNLCIIDSEWKYDGSNLLFSEHHQAHAASAFFPSPFEEAIILTVDGVGEWCTTSVTKGKGNSLVKVKEISFPHSVGLLYSAFTYYLGFKVNCDEYKVMGLAPYGEPSYVNDIFKYLIDVKPDGSFKLNMDYFGFCTGLTMTNPKFHKLFGQNPRKPGSDILKIHMDIACSIQKVTEEVMVKIANQLYLDYGIENLCLAGGVALNCVANGRILKETPFKNLWIQPAAGDAGGALGSAYTVYYEYLKNIRLISENGTRDEMKASLLGPSYSASQIKTLLHQHGLSYQEFNQNDFYQAVATKIVEGKIVGYFKGRMEFGPRALGARSILGDARNKDMQSIMNLKIKFRESFRPFAPAVMEEYASEYFNIDVPSPYMLLVAEVNRKYRKESLELESKYIGLEKVKQSRSILPAITHIDYSARIQTVNSSDNPDFYNLLNAFFKLTGCPVLINTSFNVMDEPIVCHPEDAIRCFEKSGIDVLAIENIIVEKGLNLS